MSSPIRSAAATAFVVGRRSVAGSFPSASSSFSTSVVRRLFPGNVSGTGFTPSISHHRSFGSASAFSSSAFSSSSASASASVVSRVGAISPRTASIAAGSPALGSVFGWGKFGAGLLAFHPVPAGPQLTGVRSIHGAVNGAHGGTSAHEGRIVTITSGKGGVGKTTTAASFAYGLATRGYRVCCIDFDIGLRNLDLHLGCERRVVYDFVNVILGECKLHQALVPDKHIKTLFLLAASQTRDKTVLTTDAVGRTLDELKQQFDFVVCDSPAGIENGAFQAMYFADDAIICTNPELSSVRDSDKMLGIITSQSKRAVEYLEPVRLYLLITRYRPLKVASQQMLSVQDIVEMLGVPLLGVIPDSDDVLESTNRGHPVITSAGDCSAAYEDLVARYCGEERPLRFIDAKSQGILKKIFG